MGVAGLTASGEVKATESGSSEDRLAILNEYDDPTTVRQAIDATAGDLLEELSGKGLIAEADASALPVSEVLEHREYIQSDEGATRAAVGLDPEEGTYTPEILVRRQTDRGKLFVKVLPEQGVGFAMLDDEVVVSQLGQPTTAGVEPSSCGPLVCYNACYTGNGCYVSGTCGCAERKLYCCLDGHCMWGDFKRRWVDCGSYDCDPYCDCACGFDDYAACNECG